MIEDLIEIKMIKGKRVFIFKSHHYALIPWATIRSEMKKPPIVISLDHHTDTHDPFLRYCYEQKKAYDKRFVKGLIKKINYNDLSTVEAAVKNLINDEHIMTAISSGIISKAFIVSTDNTSDKPMSYEEERKRDKWQEIMNNMIMGEAPLPEELISRPYTYPDSNIYIPAYWLESESMSHVEQLDLAIEDSFLINKFSIFEHMCPAIISNRIIKERYILDIDLDYFHTKRSIYPENPSSFYDLIKGAEAITIALEPECVELVKEQFKINDNFYSNDIISVLLEHIQNAL